MKNYTYVAKKTNPLRPRLRGRPRVAPDAAAATKSQGETCDEVCAVETVRVEEMQRSCDALPSSPEIEHMVKLFAVLSNPTRLKLLLTLEPGMCTPRRELCVCDLARLAESSQSMTSHQLSVLRDASLVVSRRAGKLVLYRLTEGPMEHLLRDAVEHVMTRTRASHPQGNL